MYLKSKKKLICGSGFLLLFVSWTAVVSMVDLRHVGPCSSAVGLASVNGDFHSFTGVHLWLYELTDILSIIPLLTVLLLGVLGAVQWIKRGNLMKVDRRLLFLGAYFVLVLAVFMLFEIAVINYRPILIEGVLEASYPSSTTLLVLSVMPPSVTVINAYLKNNSCRMVLRISTTVFCVLMVSARLVSGVHWLTDIIGGILLSASLVILYSSFADC